MLDTVLEDAAASLALGGRYAIVALGSYARRELCPGSDVDLLLLHDGAARGRAATMAAELLWYPLWDAGIVLGHATRTPKEALALADEDLETLTALLDVRRIAGDAEIVAGAVARARRLARKRSARVVADLARAAAGHIERPGPIAEVLEPNLKDGAGGLRDVHTLEWAGWALADAGGLDGLVESGYLTGSDPPVLAAATDRLLQIRVALHRVTGGRSDVLTLQEQDAVARALGIVDADRLLRDLGATARDVLWLSRDVWERVESAAHGPAGRVASGDREVADGVVVRDDRVAVVFDSPIEAERILAAASAAASLAIPIERRTLERFRDLSEPVWTDEARAAFVVLLRSGRRAIPVFEALDHVGALTRLLPEWDHVRAQPQRNAYHRFTVDRHLLEAVAECAALLDDDGFDGEVARRTRPELLLLGALLHDIGKGLPGDHSERGAAVARELTTRLGLDSHGTDIVAWLVRCHLLLADTATRRDLADEETIVRFGRQVGDTERLDLLYVLTVGDSRATGPAAWGTTKAALVRQLFAETDTLLERGVVGPGLDAEPGAALARHRELLDRGELAVAWSRRDDGLLECTVVAPDRRGLLAVVAGVLALAGFDIRGAAAYGDSATGMALEVFRGVDQFDRLDDAGRRDVAVNLASALAGAFPLRARLAERIARYRSLDGRRTAGPSTVTISYDLDASASATVVEVHAPDDVGLLARVAATFADLDLDVTAALVSTTGAQVVDVFYVRDAKAAKVTEPLVLERLRATLVARLTTDYLLR